MGPTVINNVYFNESKKIVEIFGVTKDNTGQYTITVSNRYGSAEDSFYIKVDEPLGPKIFDLQSFVRIQEDQALRLTPRVQYVGQPYFSWTGPTNDKLIENAQYSNENLFIPSVSMQNDGVYTLQLFDETGTTSAKVRVVVDRKPAPDRFRRPNSLAPVKVYESQLVEVERNESIRFDCQLQKDNLPANTMKIHTWTMIDKNKFKRNIRTNGRTLMIQYFNEENVGDYKCTFVARVGREQVKKEAILRLRLKENRPEE